MEEAVGDVSLSVSTTAALDFHMTGEQYDRFDDFVQRSIVSASTVRAIMPQYGPFRDTQVSTRIWSAPALISVVLNVAVLKTSSPMVSR